MSLPARAAPYDALLLVSFGGPEGPEDVLPFLRNVTAGKNIPDERLVEVGEHYAHFGGRSPINDQNRAFLAALRDDLSGNGVDLPVYWGNRTGTPTSTTRCAGWPRTASGARPASSPAPTRRTRAAASTGRTSRTPWRASPGAPRLDRLRHYYNHPGFVDPSVDATLRGLAALPDHLRHDAHLVFVTHSIPVAMDDASGRGRSGPWRVDGGAYTDQHHVVMASVVDRVRRETGVRHEAELVFCSRSGPPQVPWLEPDVNDHLRALRTGGAEAVVVVPIGFVSDHMEVLYDLDTEAAATAEDVGLAFVRADTAGLDPRFVSMVRDLLLERAAVERGEQVERATTGRLEASVGPLPGGLLHQPAVRRPPRPAARTPTTPP